MSKYIFYIAGFILIFNGCKVYRAYEQPDIVTAGLYRDPYSSGRLINLDTTNIGNLPWRQVFSDPYLQDLIEEGLKNNADIRTAMLKIDEAQAILLAARLAYLPSLQFTPQATISSFDRSKAIKTYELPITSSWEIDLSGRLLNSSRSAYATLIQSEAYQQMVQTSLVANIANAYYTLLMLDEQTEITEYTIGIWKDYIYAMEAMKEAGMTNEAAITQNKASYHNVIASLYELNRQTRETENALSILLGRVPQQIPRSNLRSQQMPVELTVGVPVQLLANRPDVKYAEMQFTVAWYATNQARAAFYPQLIVSGSAGWTNSAGAAVSNPGKLLLSAAASLTQPIFNRGTNIANLKVAKAQQEEALINFQQSLLTAGQEVSDALYQYEVYTEKIDERILQIDELEKAVNYTTELFQSGMSTYLEILTARQSLLAAQLNEVSDRVSRLQAVINLYKSVGGGTR